MPYYRYLVASVSDFNYLVHLVCLYNFNFLHTMQTCIFVAPADVLVASGAFTSVMSYISPFLLSWSLLFCCLLILLLEISLVFTMYSYMQYILCSFLSRLRSIFLLCHCLVHVSESCSDSVCDLHLSFSFTPSL